MNSILFKQYRFQNAMLILSLLLILFNVSAQHNNHNGNYKSCSTSFQDIKNPAKSFSVEAVNNIYIQVEGNEGMFVFQDERYPDDILTYEINSYKGEIYNKEKDIYVYSCSRPLISNPNLERIIIYVNSDGSMNLMIEDESSTQVFFDLVKQ
ncbi:hypothetical protein DZC72_04280 [Maribacter algicola]|uniref:Uncharacterized protein n=1 Tax=Maribacter algicola TaxID=2498892 RepID=A0A3R8R9C8_9FLAO|nr:hypothetical protein [Maribacter algicola]RRQ49813.1 hypothetical protein DZC72_04280 [Maribacter algicola]